LEGLRKHRYIEKIREVRHTERLKLREGERKQLLVLRFNQAIEREGF